MSKPDNFVKGMILIAVGLFLIFLSPFLDLYNVADKLVCCMYLPAFEPSPVYLMRQYLPLFYYFGCIIAIALGVYLIVETTVLEKEF